MKIQGPLVIDVSRWNDHLNIQELVDGGVASVIVGLYKKWVPFKYVLNDNCKRILDQVAASALILQTYFYYYPQNDPVKDANWFVDQMAGYPVKYAWADCENHDVSMDARLRSEQYRRFTLQLHTRFPKSGVYTANWFVAGFAPEMNVWLPHYTAWVPHYGKALPLAPTTWAQLKATGLPNYNIILAAGQPAAQVMGHQFTDRPILPGVYSALGKRMQLDVSVFKQEFLETISGHPTPAPSPAPVPVPVPQPNYVVMAGKNPNVHSGSGAGPIIGVMLAGTKICVDDSTSQIWYSHFLPQAGFPAGGWIYKSYLTKI